MLFFLKRLFQRRKERISVVLLDDTRPGEDESFQFSPKLLFYVLTVAMVCVSLLFGTLLGLTPLRSVFFTSDEQEVREHIMELGERLTSLQDSLTIRDQQLEEIKQVIRLSLDTTLTVNDRMLQALNRSESEVLFANDPLPVETYELFSRSEILTQTDARTTSQFPTSMPLAGTISREFLPEDGHFGIDIATSEDEPFRNVSDGVITNVTWTVSHAFTITVQHHDGMLSVFKHCKSSSKKKGDVVLKGDILGTAGNVGVLSTGAHLHFELWKGGSPQNPLAYLIQ
ncbi:MAG: M23 family metallopeptidase [Bacteroidota bacterium]